MSTSEFVDDFVRRFPHLKKVYECIEDREDGTSIVELEWPERRVIATFIVDGDIDAADKAATEIHQLLKDRGVDICMDYTHPAQDN